MEIRDPAILVWNFLLPCALFCFTNWSSFQTGVEDGVDARMVPYLVYIVCSNAFYGVGSVLLSWRQESFLRTFVHSYRSKLFLILSLSGGVSILNILFSIAMFSIFILLKRGGIDWSNNIKLIYLIPMGFIFSIMFSLMSLSKLSIEILNKVAGVYFILCLYGTLVFSAQDGTLMDLYNMANPIYIGANIIYKNYFYTTICLVVISILSAFFVAKNILLYPQKSHRKKI